MASRNMNGVTVECARGNIADQPDMDAVVNAANAGLRIGGGVAGAIHRAAGPGLEEECRPLAPISPGQAVITGAHNLPNEYVIHCLGPVYGADEPADELLASCYRNALRLAEENGIRSVAFPAISAGAFGYPLDEAARIAMETVVGECGKLSTVGHVRFVLFSDRDLEVFLRILGELSDKP
ncbi:MAG: macro domain-containing protein [Phycisphaerae bacterium]